MDRRPTPEALLARVREESERARRGKLTIFFGAAPGVGKTYAMLEGARLEKENGRDVVVGIVETHGRYDTGALLLGHEILPRRSHEHAGIKLEEFDLDAALRRRPGLLLVDELAHTNAPGSRHTKRFQDVEELLDAGVDVFTTLNVQHLESQKDVVAQITHVIVRETVPDSIFESADDVRLLDLPIDELLDRLREGKVYAPEQAGLARENFFQPGNLIALRELALRMTAQRVDAQMRRYRDTHGIDRTWSVTERILVSVSASPASEKLIRAAKRLANLTHGDWIAATVETPASVRESAADRERVAQHLKLALSLGAETVALSGEHAPEEIVRFARTRNVTRILVGKPTHSRWRDRLRPSFLDELVRRSGDIDVHVLTGDTAVPAKGAREPRPAVDGVGFGAAFLVVAAATFLSSFAFGPTQIADAAMAYVLAIVLVSLRWGFGPSLFAAVLAVLGFDYFFIPPLYTFAVADLSHIVTFTVMVVVATVISGLTRRVREQAESARERELRTASLYALSRGLASAKTTDDVMQAAASRLFDVFGTKVALLIVGDKGRLVPLVLDQAVSYALDDREIAVGEWVFSNGHPAGLTTDTLPSARALYLPLQVSSSRIGVVGLLPGDKASDKARLGALDRRQHLDAFLEQISAAIERTRLAAQAQDAQLRIEAEQLRNALLSSVSHDLRTPLAVITGTASTILDARVDEATKRELTESILTEAERLNRLLRNLLDMTRLEAGAVTVHKEWQPVEEAVGAALDRTAGVLGAREVVISLGGGADPQKDGSSKARVDDHAPSSGAEANAGLEVGASPSGAPGEILLAPFDSLLLQQVLVNLLENAAKYTPESAGITIVAQRDDNAVTMGVLDRGPGIPKGDEARVFDKFYRANAGQGAPRKGPGGAGVGLGLTIAKAIVTAHGGRMWAENRTDGTGAAFRFTLPLDAEGEPPPLSLDSEPASAPTPPTKTEQAAS